MHAAINTVLNLAKKYACDLGDTHRERTWWRQLWQYQWTNGRLSLKTMSHFGRNLTGYLYAIPTFMAGMARVLDLYGTYDSYNESASGDEADAVALRNDWAMVGQDVQDAMNAYEQESQA